MPFDPLVRAAIERKTGKTIEELQAQTLPERRKEVEDKHGSPMQFVSYFPFIGRKPHVLLTHEEVEKEFRKAVR